MTAHSFERGLRSAPFLRLIEGVVGKALQDSFAARGAAPAQAEIERIAQAIAVEVEGLVQREAGTLLNELTGLSDLIERTRHDIADLTDAQGGGSHFQVATDELDAVIGATESATNDIMDACEEIEAGCTEAQCSEQIMGAITRIYEACSFQDITGQRLSKVVGAVKEIESRLHTMIAGVEERCGLQPRVEPRNGTPAIRAAVPASASVAQTDDEAGLLNGPQLPGNGIDQNAVDKLFD